MTKLKAYTINRAMIRPDLVQALGLPRHIQHADVVVVAESKAAAAEMTIAAEGVYRASERELRLASGTVGEAYQQADLYNQPRILVTAAVGHPSDRRVIEVAPDGQVTVIGHLHHDQDGGRYTRRFVAVTPVTLRYTAGNTARTVRIPRSAWEAMTPAERRSLADSIALAVSITAEWETSEPIGDDG